MNVKQFLLSICIFLNVNLLFSMTMSRVSQFHKKNDPILLEDQKDGEDFRGGRSISNPSATPQRVVGNIILISDEEEIKEGDEPEDDWQTSSSASALGSSYYQVAPLSTGKVEVIVPPSRTAPSRAKDVDTILQTWYCDAEIKYSAGEKIFVSHQMQPNSYWKLAKSIITRNRIERREHRDAIEKIAEVVADSRKGEFMNHNLVRQTRWFGGPLTPRLIRKIQSDLGIERDQKRRSSSERDQTASIPFSIEKKVPSSESSLYPATLINRIMNFFDKKKRAGYENIPQ